MKKTIGLIRGDGIGPEIVAEAKKALDRTEEIFGHEFSYVELLLGGASIDACGEPLTKETVAEAKKCDAILMGSIGGDPLTSPWYQLPSEKRPEAGLLGLRKALSLFANLRPAFLYPDLRSACPLRADIAEEGCDLMMVRELTGGLYFGERKTEVVNGLRTATDTLIYNEEEIRRIVRLAFEIAQRRSGHLTMVDKENVLDSSRLWRSVTDEIAPEYPDVTCDIMLVDNCAMQLMRKPSQFDVIVTENMFGDILSDEASMITGSLGMLPSASLNEEGFGLYEPSGGSAPDIAGMNLANPIATILSAAMLLRYSFDMQEEADALEQAVAETIEAGIRTKDIAGEGAPFVYCDEMGSEIAKRIRA